MFSSRFVRWGRLDRLGPKAGVTDRAITLAFTARFTDESLSGAWDVLAPTFRRTFGLSLIQVGLLSQVLSWVALVVEPLTATMIDLHSRRRLLALGAGALAGSMLAMAVAPSYGWLLVAFAAFGLGSGPLALTGDVLVVESFPDAPERAYARSTLMDTAGALLGPALIAGATLAQVSWRLVLAGLGAGAAVYAGWVTVTDFPAAPRQARARRPLLREALSGMRAAVANGEIRRSLVVLLCFDLFEAAFVLKYIWLHDSVGLSVSAVALWAAGEQLVDFVALLLLDRWLTTRSPGRLFRLAAGALIALPVAWVAAPGVAGRVVLGVPLAFAHTLIWPLAKSQSLTVDPELAGATQAITALFTVVPFALMQSAFAEAVGIGPAMAATAAVGAAAMLVASRRPVPLEPVAGGPE